MPEHDETHDEAEGQRSASPSSRNEVGTTAIAMQREPAAHHMKPAAVHSAQVKSVRICAVLTWQSK